MGTLYRSKKNGMLYKLYLNFGRMTGSKMTATPFHHNETLKGNLKMEDFEPVAELRKA